MKKIFYLIPILIFIAGCDLETPEIHGVVLDADTKQPVENAWISASIELNSKTIGGDVHSAWSIDNPHTRTDKQGKFVIPSKNLRSSIGAEVLSFGVGASTIDDKSGEIKYFGGYYKRDYGKGDGDLAEILKENRAEFTIYVKPIERTESEYFYHLQSLYNYCISGRFSVEVPAVKEGCDNWELDYAITKHERYLERYKQVVEKDVNTVAFGQLAYLYEKKGSYEKAIETLEKSVVLIERRGLLKFEVWQNNKSVIEKQINELQQKLRERQNKGVTR